MTHASPLRQPGLRPRCVLHFDDPTLIQMVTFRLADALPGWDARPPAMSTIDPDAAKLWFRRYDGLLDQHHGACLLARDDVATIVREALLFGARERYALYGWVVMPNHVHVLMQTTPGWSLSRIMRDLKGFTARRINVLLGREGAVWQKEYYDRYMRNPRHFDAGERYIAMNPVKAGLVEAPHLYRWSSAFVEAAQWGHSGSGGGNEPDKAT